uniref:Uncharacterized protein n=1 Tax=Anguilla anguilla TaxID=7936 RepID=A0A0E9UUU5_ANGAN
MATGSLQALKEMISAVF